MLSLSQRLLLLLLFSLTLQAQNGLSQKHLVSLSPEPSAKDISADTSIEIIYDLAISKDSVHKRVIILKNSKKKKIKGKVRVKNKNTLIFTPNEELISGEYRVKVKHINLQDYKLNTRFTRYAKKVCSYFYDDVKECRLYRYASRVKTKQIKYSFTVDDNKPKVINLTLNKSDIQLNEDNTTTISVNAKYNDNTTLDVTNDVEWIISNPNIITIDKNIITPINEGTTTLQAKLNNQTTKQISLTVYKEINGHKLPPEPDETLNDSTLLGIDSNNNGVRDDVERWIYETYQDKHPIHIDIAMQAGRAYKQVLETPERALEIHDTVVNAPLYCAWYYQHDAEEFGDLLLVEERVDVPVKSQYFNTPNRNNVYWEYDTLLSGGSYPLPKTKEMKAMCDFDTTKYEK